MHYHCHVLHFHCLGPGFKKVDNSGLSMSDDLRCRAQFHEDLLSP